MKKFILQETFEKALFDESDYKYIEQVNVEQEEFAKCVEKRKKNNILFQKYKNICKWVKKA